MPSPSLILPPPDLDDSWMTPEQRAAKARKGVFKPTGPGLQGVMANPAGAGMRGEPLGGIRKAWLGGTPPPTLTPLTPPIPWDRRPLADPNAPAARVTPHLASVWGAAPSGPVAVTESTMAPSVRFDAQGNLSTGAPAPAPVATVPNEAASPGGRATTTQGTPLPVPAPDAAAWGESPLAP